jgi:hypothetical protein
MLWTNAEDPLRSTDHDLGAAPLAGGELLFWRLARHNGFIDQQTLDNSLSQRQTNRAKTLAGSSWRVVQFRKMSCESSSFSAKNMMDVLG